MTIQSGDIKILASKVMDDVPEGGGGPSGTVIPDNNSNAVFTDVSEVDRAGGAASIRQVHTHVQTQDVDRFLGAHIIVSRIPNDENVAVTLAECNPFDRRTDIATAIENYLIQGPEWGGYLFENHVQGQRSIQLFQRPGTPTPPIGRTLVLIKDEGLVTEYKQYVRVTSVETEDRTFTYSTGGGYVDYTGTVVTCDISDALREAFPGSPADRAFARSATKALVRDTTVADAATYYGAVPMSAAANLGDISAKVVGIYSQLVPSARTETAAIDQKPAAQRLLTLASTPRLIEVGIVPHSLRIRVGQENRGFSWVQMLKPLPAPGTVVISFMALGNWYTVQDDGAGGFTGSGTGVINYATGSIAVTFPSMPDAGSSVLFQWGENTAFLDQSGGVTFRPPEYSWQLPQKPVKPGTVTVTWVSGGSLRTATASAAGAFSGDAAGEIAHATGHIRLRPAHMIDAGGEFSIAYTHTTEVTQDFAGVSTDAGGFATLALAQEPAPRSIAVRWITVRNCTTGSGSTEAVTKNTTTLGVGPEGETVLGLSGGGCVLEPLNAAPNNQYPSSATAQLRFYRFGWVGQEFSWEVAAVTGNNGIPVALADGVTGPTTGTFTLGAGHYSTFSLALAAPAGDRGVDVQVRDSTLALVARLTVWVVPALGSGVIRPDHILPPPCDVLRAPLGGVGAVAAMRLGGVTDAGGPVYVACEPLRDDVLGYCYDPPSTAAQTTEWSPAELAAGEKSLTSQRGVTTLYKIWK